MLWFVACCVMIEVRWCCLLLVDSWSLTSAVVCCRLSFLVSCLFVCCLLLLFVAWGVPFPVCCSLCLVRHLLSAGCSSWLFVGAWCLVRCLLLALGAAVRITVVCEFLMCVVVCCALVVARCHLLLWLMNVFNFVLFVLRFVGVSCFFGVVACCVFGVCVCWFCCVALFVVRCVLLSTGVVCGWLLIDGCVFVVVIVVCCLVYVAVCCCLLFHDGCRRALCVVCCVLPGCCRLVCALLSGRISCSLCVARCLLADVCCLRLFGVCCVLILRGNFMFVSCCVLIYACVVGCCLLFVVRCVV